MRRKKILVAGIVLAVFCLGVYVGRHAGRSPSSASNALRASSRRDLAGCFDFRAAGSHAGETGCVAGRVLKVFTSGGGNTFLDFCEDYHDCPFSSVIFSSDKRKFGNLQSLTGRQIEIRGLISVYQGRPEIIISDPDQIRMAPE
jgi:hypothetical protein